MRGHNILFSSKYTTKQIEHPKTKPSHMENVKEVE